jgi:hypothetical protein
MSVPFYNTKTLGGRTDARWYEAKALPAPRYGPGASAPPAQYGTAGQAGVDQVDGASLDVAMAAGLAALQAGYGGVLPGGQAPCGTCPSCTYGHPEGCRRPKQKAVAQLEAAQAQARRIDRAERWAVELQGIVWREEQRRQLAL